MDKDQAGLLLAVAGLVGGTFICLWYLVKKIEAADEQAASAAQHESVMEQASTGGPIKPISILN